MGEQHLRRWGRRFPLALLGKGKDLIPGFTETYEDENGQEYDLTQQIRGTPPWQPLVSEEKKQQRRRLAIAQDKLIEKLYLAFFKDLTHWIIFILCKINERVVEPVPIKNNIISGCLPQHIEIYKDTHQDRNVKSSWCYHIKPNEDLFYRSFEGSIITTERDVTEKEFKAANMRLELKEKAAKKRLEFEEKGKKLVKEARKRQKAKENAKKADKRWVPQRSKKRGKNTKKRRLMDDNINLKF